MDYAACKPSLEQCANPEDSTAATRKRPLGNEQTTPTRPPEMCKLVAVPQKQEQNQHTRTTRLLARRMLLKKVAETM